MGGARALPTVLVPRPTPPELDPVPPVTYAFPDAPPVVCRSVSARMRSHDDVGNVLWPASVVFSRWILAHKDVFAGACVAACLWQCWRGGFEQAHSA